MSTAFSVRCVEYEKLYIEQFPLGVSTTLEEHPEFNPKTKTVGSNWAPLT